MKPKQMFKIESLTDKQFEAIINMMYMYKQLNKNDDVWFTESGIKKVLKEFKMLN